jgi:nucleotide-binding universal stress UspA family protein
MQVLIGLDGSPNGFEAIRQACRILSADRDEITFYYSPPGVELIRSSAGSTVHQGRQALAQSVFAQALSYLPVDWPAIVKTVIGTTDPREGMLQTAEEMHADLMVVGGRHYNTLERLLLASVSRAVAHAAQVPVLIARAPENPRTTPDYRVLVAFESQQSAKRLSTVLERFHWPTETSAIALHVVQTEFGGKIPDWLEAQARAPDAEALVKLWVKDHDEQLAGAAQLVRSVCREFPGRLKEADQRVSEGVPAQEIIGIAEVQKSDLVVVGAKASTQLGRLLIGSTAEFVLNHAHCSVLLVHNPVKG